MKIPKEKAITLIDEKIAQFQALQTNATYANRFDEGYHVAYYGTKTLLTDLFSEKERQIFQRSVSSLGGVISSEIDYAKEVRDYKEHLGKCISQLRIYRERIVNFWVDDPLTTELKKGTIPFISMSFDDADREINNYVTGMLRALQVEFETGERYSKDSIPQKVQSRIQNSDLFIIVFVRRDKIEGGGYTTPSWLLKELGLAQGAKKEVVAWVERGIKDIAGLNYEKQVIYFDRDNTNEIRKATITFLEALKEHKLI